MCDNSTSLSLYFVSLSILLSIKQAITKNDSTEKWKMLFFKQTDGNRFTKNMKYHHQTMKQQIRHLHDIDKFICRKRYEAVNAAKSWQKNSVRCASNTHNKHYLYCTCLSCDQIFAALAVSHHALFIYKPCTTIAYK